MKKIAVIVLCITTLCVTNASAQEKALHFRFGAEWGLTATLFEHHHFNYFEKNLGYRVNERIDALKLFPNACAEIFIGTDIGRKWNLSLRGGIAGYLSDLFFPLKVRATLTPAGSDRDGWLWYAEGGPMLGRRLGGDPDFAGCGGIGAGYRVSPGGRTAIDFTLSLRSTLSHPQIIDEESGAPLPAENIGRANRVCTALSFSISLSF